MVYLVCAYHFIVGKGLIYKAAQNISHIMNDINHSLEVTNENHLNAYHHSHFLHSHHLLLQTFTLLWTLCFDRLHISTDWQMSSKALLVSTAIFYHYIYFVVLCLRLKPFDLQGFPDPETCQIYLSYIVQNTGQSLSSRLLQARLNLLFSVKQLNGQ